MLYHTIYYVHANDESDNAATRYGLDRFAQECIKYIQRGAMGMVSRHYYESLEGLETPYEFPHRNASTVGATGYQSQSQMATMDEELWKAESYRSNPCIHRLAPKAHLHLVYRQGSKNSGWEVELRRILKVINQQLCRYFNEGFTISRCSNPRSQVRCQGCLQRYLSTSPRNLDEVRLDSSFGTGCTHNCNYNQRRTQGIDECNSCQPDATIGTFIEGYGFDSSRSITGSRKRKSYNQGPQWRQELIRICQENKCSSIPQVRTILANHSDEDIQMIPFQKMFEKMCITVLMQEKCKYQTRQWEDIWPDIQIHMYPDCLSPEESALWIKRILTFNNIDMSVFFQCVYNVMNKVQPKHNGLILFGEKNCGKTLIGLSLCRSAIYYSTVQNFDLYNTFYLQDVLHSRVALLNEPKIDQGKFETFKNILEGQTVSIDVKYQGCCDLERTPMIICTNFNLAQLTIGARINEDAVDARTFRFNMRPFSELQNCLKKLHPLAWPLLMHEFNICL